MQAGLDAMRRGEQYTEDYGFGGLQEALGATRAGQQVLGRSRRHCRRTAGTAYAYQQAAVADIGRAADMSREAAQAGYQALGGTGHQFDPYLTSLYTEPPKMRWFSKL